MQKMLQKMNKNKVSNKKKYLNLLHYRSQAVTVLHLTNKNEFYLVIFQENIIN